MGKTRSKSSPKTKPNLSFHKKEPTRGLYHKDYGSAAGNTMKSQFSLMGYGINKKFLCKLDPEQYSNGYGYEYM